MNCLLVIKCEKCGEMIMIYNGEVLDHKHNETDGKD